jgi:hypothetical protein
MAQKRLRRITSSRGSGKGSSGANNKTRSLSVPRSQRQGKRTTPDLSRFRSPLGPIDPAKLSRDTRSRVINALNEGREHPNFPFSTLAKRWHLDPRSFYRHAKQAIRTDASGHVRVRPSDHLRLVLQIPTTKPGEYQTIVTRSSKERQQLGEWWAAMNEARAGKFARLNAFPKNTLIDGVRLPTSPYEVQKLLDALEAEGSKFAGPYRLSGSPS